MPALNGKTLIVLLLLWGNCWEGLGENLTQAGAADFCHHVLVDGGQHCCEEFCELSSSLVQPDLTLGATEVLTLEAPLARSVIALLPHLYLARAHPPPLFYSLSHSLRAPPTLILA